MCVVICIYNIVQPIVSQFLAMHLRVTIFEVGESIYGVPLELFGVRTAPQYMYQHHNMCCYYNS